MKYSISERIFIWINTILLVIFAFICLFPFLHVVAKSFSSNEAITSGSVYMFPEGFQIQSYLRIFKTSQMITSMKFTILLTITSVALSLVSSVLIAYPLSRSNLRGKKIITIIITFTMYFSGGTIPNYMLIKNLGLLDTAAVLVLPAMISTYNVIIMKTFFMSIPESLIEAASIDGCNPIKTLCKIVLPLSKAMLATMTLFYGVSRWNAYQDALFYTTSLDIAPLQLVLRNIINSAEINDINAEMEFIQPESLKSATLVFATVPILLVYPWLQKYFVKGTMVGAVKE